MGTFEVAADFRAALDRLSLDCYETAMGHSGGTLLSEHRGRSVVQIGGSLYLKRFIGKPAEADRELRAYALLESGPGPDPVPVAARGSGEAGAFIITARPPSALPLPEASAVLEGAARRSMARALGMKIRELHDRGLTCPDLLAHHLLVSLPDTVFLLDAGRLARRRSSRARARDLAALELSLPYGRTTRTDRVRFLQVYCRNLPMRVVLAEIARAHRKLDRRSRHRTRRVVAGPAARAFFTEHGIRTFADFTGYSGAGAVCLRALADRENWKVTLSGRVFYVKRHRPVKGLANTPAAAEWEAVHLLRRTGVRVMRAAAYAEDVREGSALWVERAPGLPIDDLLREGVPPKLRRELVLEAAVLLGRMHRHEIHHRDMYCCHLIADRTALPGERLTLIDLQRARRKRGLRIRWYVKDLAQLLHSAPRPPVTGADLARFLRAYFGVAKLGPAEKRFARRVRRKAARI